MQETPPRECPMCPPWVVGCAHMPDGRILMLIEHAAGALPKCPQGCYVSPEPFNLAVNDGRFETCPKNESCERQVSSYGYVKGHFETYDDALAAFRAAEQELLQGAPS